MTETHHVEPERAADVATELWQVRVSTSEVRVMTFEQLEAAFREGVITEDTYVLDEGSTEWRTLRAIAGRDPVETKDDASPASPKPVSTDTEDADTDYDLQLVDFRRGQRTKIAIAIAGAAALGIVVLIAVSLKPPPLTLPTPWLDAPSGSVTTGGETAEQASPSSATDDERGMPTTAAAQASLRVSNKRAVPIDKKKPEPRSVREKSFPRP